MNILIDPWCPVRSGDGSGERLSLAGLFERLVTKDDFDIPVLRPHQAPALHAFLVQLGFLALESTPGPLPETEMDWAAALRRLTADWRDDEPWHLIGSHLSSPAFLQPPAPAESASQYKKTVRSPDECDILVTSRNHDLKAARMIGAGPAEWVFALISLQTFEGFLGQGNYGIARMNGGFASRPQFRLAPARGIGAEFRRDLLRLRGAATELREAATASGVGTSSPIVRLAWLESWDGTTSLPLSRLHPLGIEICRRIRLERTDLGSLQGRTATSKCARIAAGESRGAVADPWIPLDLQDKQGAVKAFTATANGLQYGKLSEVLFDSGKYRLPLQALASREERRRPATLIAQVLVRGQGKTEGFHQREVHLPAALVARVADRDQLLAARARAFVDLAASVHGRALRPALIQYVDGSDDPDWRNPQHLTLIAPFTRMAEAATDRDFFTDLAQSFDDDLSDEAATLSWGHRLARQAQLVLNRAIDSLPTRGSAPVLAGARAQSRLRQGLLAHVPGQRDSKQPLMETSNEPIGHD